MEMKRKQAVFDDLFERDISKQGVKVESYASGLGDWVDDENNTYQNKKNNFVLSYLGAH